MNRWLKGIYWSEMFGEFRETTDFEAVSTGFLSLIFRLSRWKRVFGRVSPGCLWMNVWGLFG